MSLKGSITLNPNVLRAEYAVRGELAIRAEQLSQSLARGDHLPFTKVISCNIGNPQQLGQPPISFFRQVLSFIECPQLMNAAGCEEDVRARVESTLEMVGPSTGAYTHSMGVLGFRRQIAEFMSERDGMATDPNDIYMTNGASEAIHRVISLFASSDRTGVLIPIPQYPLYAATVALASAVAVPYYLDEDQDWLLTGSELERAVCAAADVDHKIVCVINPGNPTGSCLSRAEILKIFDFALRHSLVVLFDEVYQENWYTDGHFVSARSCIPARPEYSQLHLFTFHSTSKGLIGECGKRGGWVHYEGSSRDIRQQMYKLASISLCPNIQGQVLVRPASIIARLA